ncbi:hypothetical protein, unlikely [Trypanosoma brucei brucei TREU927]|uniref:Uncharacterized protein n=1 Tax=Trypanosoma brucei brucei (strain 927/4 GUTat10.1) TaxID=185431 RepID=Q38DI0_TRYB2|nr:hypothetical protein, unlikely [Trypanosoma brucei brucei TREU927]EAN77140.1 hypothetical protein, unlikely [Trypanosoma brucei brucei TREU927]
MKIGIVVDSLKQAVVFTTAVTVVIICRKGVACETKNKMINGVKRKEEIIPAISILFFSFFNLFFSCSFTLPYFFLQCAQANIYTGMRTCMKTRVIITTITITNITYIFRYIYLYIYIPQKCRNQQTGRKQTKHTHTHTYTHTHNNKKRQAKERNKQNEREEHEKANPFK